MHSTACLCEHHGPCMLWEYIHSTTGGVARTYHGARTRCHRTYTCSLNTRCLNIRQELCGDCAVLVARGAHVAGRVRRTMRTRSSQTQRVFACRALRRAWRFPGARRAGRAGTRCPGTTPMCLASAGTPTQTVATCPQPSPRRLAVPTCRLRSTGCQSYCVTARAPRWRRPGPSRRPVVTS